MTEEEKKTIKEIKKDEDYYYILHNLQETKYVMWDAEKFIEENNND